MNISFSHVMRKAVLHMHLYSFYALSFKEVEVEGAYWFGSVRAVSQSVSQSVCLSVMCEHSVRKR